QGTRDRARKLWHPRIMRAQPSFEHHQGPELRWRMGCRIALLREEAADGIRAERPAQTAFRIGKLAAREREDAGSGRARLRDAEAALGKSHQVGWQIAPRELTQHQLPYSVAVERLARQALGETGELDTQERRAYLERMTHAHAIDLGQHGARQIVH